DRDGHRLDLGIAQHLQRGNIPRRRLHGLRLLRLRAHAETSCSSTMMWGSSASVRSLRPRTSSTKSATYSSDMIANENGSTKYTGHTIRPAYPTVSLIEKPFSAIWNV